MNGNKINNFLQNQLIIFTVISFTLKIVSFLTVLCLYPKILSATEESHKK